MKRLEFTDNQKAFIFKRDKWLCAFSGKILWILHYWSSILWDTDWVDHIKPAVKWWDNSIENWICASSFFNSKKKDNSYDNKFLFKNGKATIYFYIANWYFSEELSNYIIDIKNINTCDWYFNKALQNILISVARLISPYDWKWKIMIRDSEYWVWASLKKINKWRKISNNETYDNFIKRLNINPSLLWEDQKILLGTIKANNTDDLLLIANKLLPYYKNSIAYFESLNNINNIKELEYLEHKINNEIFLSIRDKKILLGAIRNKNFIINN